MEWDELTPREKQVIALVAFRLSNRHIGLVLGISHRTVQEYRLRARKTLGFGSQADLSKGLAYYWPDIVKIGAPEMLRFLERAVVQLKTEIAWAERELLERQRTPQRGE